MNVNMRAYLCLDRIQEGRLYQFLVPVGAPFAEAEEIAKEMVQAVIDMKNQAQIKAEQEKEALNKEMNNQLAEATTT